MKKERLINHYSFKILLFSLVAIIVSSGSAQAENSSNPYTQDIFPEKLGEWTRARNPEVFIGDELFDLINGGAEIYFEYGFDRVTVSDYERGDDYLSIEIYQMTDSAYGIYSFLKGNQDEPIDLGNGGSMTDYYLLFWSGRSLVTVTAQSEFDDLKETLLTFAGAVSEKLPADGQRPELMNLLPTENLREGSEKYLAGPIGLQNYSIKAIRLFRGYEGAAMALYGEANGEECKLFIFDWSDESATAAALEGAANKSEGKTGQKTKFDNKQLVIEYEDGTKLTASAEGRFLVATIGPECLSIELVLDKIRRNK